MKDEFLVFSDLHLHGFPYGAKEVQIPGFSGTYNSRVADTIAALRELHAYAKKHGIQAVLFGGDMLHVRSSVSTQVHYLLIEVFKELTQGDIEWHLLLGNHDMADKFGHSHSLAGLGCLEHVYVYTKPDRVSLSDRGPVVHFVPYTPDLDQAKQWLKQAGEQASLPSKWRHVLLAHLGMQGATVGSDYVMVKESDVGVPDVPHDKFDACFFGHFHEHQPLFPNGWFIGATTEHNWGDSGGKRGFLHVVIDDDDHVSIKRIETQAPKFITVEEGRKPPVLRPNDFVRVVTTEDTDATALASRLGVDRVEMIRPVLQESDSFSLDARELDPFSAMEAWARSKAPAGMDVEKLIREGKRILGEHE